MGVLLSAKGQRRELERQYSEDKGRTRRSKTKVENIGDVPEGVRERGGTAAQRCRGGWLARTRQRLG